MTREGAREKGIRYLSEGRLIVQEIDRRKVRATCRGTGCTYDLGFDAASASWWCSCPARTRCAHLWALETVTVNPTGEKNP
jgi:uncharacterized Zn finger protein